MKPSPYLGEVGPFGRSVIVPPSSSACLSAAVSSNSVVCEFRFAHALSRLDLIDARCSREMDNVDLRAFGVVAVIDSDITGDLRGVSRPVPFPEPSLERTGSVSRRVKLPFRASGTSPSNPPAQLYRLTRRSTHAMDVGGTA